MLYRIMLHITSYTPNKLHNFVQRTYILTNNAITPLSIYIFKTELYYLSYHNLSNHDLYSHQIDH